ncbi:MAG: sulfotransferase [Sphingomonadaceae bacterium]|nr:sulfotransferase [Sphingomonadaceae bacterium]
MGVPCVFVLSTGRVGSQTLAALYALSPHAHAEHEPSPVLTYASFEAYRDRCESPHWRTLVYGARDETVLNAAARGRVYVETNNRLTYLAPALADAFPDSRFIHLHRDPLAVIRSGMARGYFVDNGWDYARIRPRLAEPDAALWPRMSQIERCAWWWARVNDEALDVMGRLPPERRLDLPAERLFGADPTTIAALFALAGLRTPPPGGVAKVLGARLNAQGRRAAPLAAADVDAAYAFAGPTAERLGYQRPISG